MTRALVLSLLVVGLVQVGPGLGSELAGAVGLEQVSAALGEADSAQAAFIRRSKLRKKRTVGYRPVVVVGSDESGDAGDVDTVHLTFTDYSGPQPLTNPVVLGFVSADAESGDRTYAATLDFDGDAVGEEYVVLYELQGADGAVLGQGQGQLLVEAPGPPAVVLDVLNVPNAAGDVVVITGDAIEVSFNISCDEPWDDDECAAQLEVVEKARVQLVAADGTQVDSKKVGKGRTAGSVTLKTNGATFGVSSVQLTVRNTSGGWDAVASAPVTLVGSAAEAALTERVGVLEGEVAAQSALLSLNKDRIAEIVELVEELASRTVANGDNTAGNTVAIAKLDEQVAANTAGVGANLETTAKHGTILIQHLMLISDEKISFDAAKKVIDSNTSAIAALDDRVKVGEGGIETNTAGLADARKDIDAFGTVAQQTADVLRAELGGAGEVFGTSDFEFLGAAVSMTLSESGGTFRLELPAQVQDKMAADATVTATFRMATGGFQIPEKVVMEKKDDFYGSVVPFGSPAGVADVAGIYRVDFEIPLADGTVLGPFTAFVEAQLVPSGAVAVSASATFDEVSKTAQFVIEVSTDGTIDPEDALKVSMLPQGDASPTKLQTYTMLFAGETPKTWIFQVDGVTFVNADKVKGGKYDLVFDDDYVRTISVDI